MRLVLASVLALATVACGGFEGSATQKIKLQDNDISGTTIAAEKELDSATSSFSQYLADAKKELGADPESIEVTSVKLSFDAAESKNVGKFEDVLKGTVVVFLKAKETNEIVDVGSIENPTGSGTVELDAEGVDLVAKGGKFSSGQFKVGIRGDSVKASTDDFELQTTVTLGLEAK